MRLRADGALPQAPPELRPGLDQSFALDSWARSGRFARDLGETFCEQKVSPKPLSKRLYMLRVKQDNFSTKYKNSRPEPSLLFVFID